MIIDGYLQFDPNGSAITVTRDSTNTLDLLNARDLGVGGFGGSDLKIVVYGSTAFAGGTSLNIQVQTAPDSGSGTPGTYTVAIETGAIPVASLIANSKLLETHWPHRARGAALPRYIKLTYVVVGTFTAGAVSAEAIIDVESAPAYPAGVVVNN